MPYRTLNIDEIAEYLHLSRAEIERLVKDQQIPFERRGGRLVFVRGEIDAWASQRILDWDKRRLADYHARSSKHTRSSLGQEPLLADLIQPEFIDPALQAKTKASVIREMANLADRTGLLYDRPGLIRSLEEREALCSTAMPGGVAFLHPRHQQPHLFGDSFVVLGRTVQPIHFGSHDGRPTDLFFLICCQDDKLHLHTLARLALLGHNTDVLEQLHSGVDAEAMHRCLVEAEHAVIESLRTRGGGQ